MDEPPLIAPRPHLVTILEAVASIMGVNDGRLELVFEHSRLVRWYSHSEKKRAGDLREFDSQAPI